MSEDTPIDLPVGLRWVKLVCRLGRLVTDSAADADPYPDLLPARGTLTLTTSPNRLRIQEADGRWRSVEAVGREYNIRADGELVDDQGRVGVWMPDPASLLVEPQGYAVTAAVKPTGGTGWNVTIGGDTVLPDVVDLVAMSSVGSVSPSVAASFDARIAALEGILAAGGSGVDVGQAVEDYLAANPPTWDTIADKPAVVAAGATATEARTAIGAQETLVDTGVVNLASILPAFDTELHNDWGPEYTVCRLGPIVVMSVTIFLKNPTANLRLVGFIPAGYRPSTFMQLDGSGNLYARLYSNGNLEIQRKNTATPWEDGAVVSFYITYATPDAAPS